MVSNRTDLGNDGVSFAFVFLLVVVANVVLDGVFEDQRARGVFTP